MMELLGRSAALRRLAWGVVLAMPLTAAVWKAADIVRAIAAVSTH